MKRYTNFVVKHKKIIVTIFFVAAAICMALSTLVKVDYDFADYLPDDAQSTKALDVMNEEYNQAIPNMRVMVYKQSIPEALAMKKKLEAVDGVQEVNWLDDSISMTEPLETADRSVIDTWYKNKNALYQLTIDEEKQDQVVKDVRKIIGDKNCMTGTAVTNALSPQLSSIEVQKIIIIIIPIIFMILFLTTTSWFEPVLFMVAIGVAVMMNRGTNLLFGTISFVTNAAGGVLQLAVSMDYSIFLLHRFAENREKGFEAEEAMKHAIKESVGSVLSSGLTTVSGFAALVLMRFKIGPDMGWVMAKAIVLSLFSVLCFLPALTLLFYKYIDKTEHRSFMPSFKSLGKRVLRVRIPIMILFFVVLIPGILGQQKNSFYYGGSEVYSTDETQLGRDMLAVKKEYGTSEALVLMVPKGDMEKEIKLNKELKNTKDVSSVISYVNSVGSTIPEGFVPTSQVSKLYSKNYSRFVISVDVSEGSSDWNQVVDKIKGVGKKYYGNKTKFAGNLASTEDLKTTIQNDSKTVNFLAILFVFVILLFNFKSISVPIILTLVIEASIWINLSIPYFKGTTLFYIGYLIISSVQLGATIDYGILFTDRYMELRQKYPKKETIYLTVKKCALSILTSASILTIAGFVLGKVSTNGVLSQLGIMLGRGALISYILVMFILPILLGIFDRVIEKTTKGVTFYGGRNCDESK